MKKAIKFTNLLMLILLLTAFSCNNDDEPVIINLQDLEVTIDENPTAGQLIGTVLSDSNSSLIYSITTQTPSGAISINASTGELSVADASLFDFETNPIITATISATDAANTATVTINLTNIEVTVQDLVVTIDENPTNGQVVGTVQTTASGTSSFSITNQTPANALSIDAGTGELAVVDAMLFDFETNPVITASVIDGESVNPATVTINLTNVNEVTVQDSTISIDENPSNGQSIVTIQTSGGVPLNFSITSQSPVGALNIDANTGELIVADETLFDYETNPTITATITVDDAINPASITINLNDLDESATIGEFRDGGVVIWVNPADNNHGLVVAVNSQSFGADWGCQGTSVPGTSTGIATGAANTALIEAACTTQGTAADIAANLSINGYDDWFLPSRQELEAYYANKDIINAEVVANGGTIPNQFYWTSTEGNANVGIVVNLTSGVWGGAGKNFLYGVRAVRAF